MFAGAGILWGAVTVYRGLQTWQHEKGRTPFPYIRIVGAVLAVSCLGYLVYRL